MKAHGIFVIASILLLNAVFSRSVVYSQTGGIVRDNGGKTITLTGNNGDLKIRINYSQGCVLDEIIVNGTEVTGQGNVVYSGFKSGNTAVIKHGAIPG